jgi:DNA-binding SARP family transcriptional activator
MVAECRRHITVPPLLPDSAFGVWSDLTVPTSDSAVIRNLERSGSLTSAQRLADEALASAGNDFCARAAALVSLARLSFRRGDYSAACAQAHEAITLAPADEATCAEATWLMGACRLETDDMLGGERLLRFATCLARRIPLPRLLCQCLHSLASGVYMPRGEFDLALAADEEAHRIATQERIDDLLGKPLLTMAWVSWLAGDLRRAVQLANNLREIAPDGSLEEGYVHCLDGYLALERQNFAAAQEPFTRALSIAERIGSPELQVVGRLGYSRLRRLTGDLPSGWAWANDALVHATGIGYAHLQGMALIERGRCAWQLGRRQQGRADLESALALLAPMQLNYDAARAALCLSAALLEIGDSEATGRFCEAARLLLDGGFMGLLQSEPALMARLISAHLSSGNSAAAMLSTELLARLSTFPAPPLSVQLFGQVRISVGGRPVEPRMLRQRRAHELVALLLLAPGYSLSFEQISEALWPDRDPSLTRTLFHHACASLRRALEPELPNRFPSRYVEVTEGHVSLCIPPGSSIDLEQFHRLRIAGRAGDALAIAANVLLAEHPYAEWACQPREQIEQLTQELLLIQARASLAEGDARTALDAARRLLTLEPWHEEATAVGMQAAAQLGDRAAGLRLYQRLAKALDADLGTVPDPDLQTQFRRLKGDSEASGANRS